MRGRGSVRDREQSLGVRHRENHVGRQTTRQCSRKRVRQLKKRKKSCFLDFEKKTLKNVKKRTGRSTQPVVSQAT